MGGGAGLDVLEKILFSCSIQVLNPRSSSVYPSYFIDRAAPY